MIKDKRLYGISIIINVCYLLILTFAGDPLKENYSMLSSSRGGYLAVMAMCILMGINLYSITRIHNRKYSIAAFLGPLIGALFPYTANSGSLFSNLHEICAYISFSIVNIVCFLNIYRYRLKDLKRGRLYMNIFIFVFVADAFLFMNSMGAVAYEQFILLGTILVISYLIYE